MIVDWVPYGRPAAAALRAAIAAAKGDDPLAPVTVVVPSNHVGVATRRLLASGALGPVCGRGVGVAGVTFVTVYRLAELLGAPGLAAAGRRPVSTPVIAAALRAALADDAGVFAPVAAHPATEAALVAAYRELRDLPSGALDAVARRSPRAADVVRLHRAARARLERGWYDEEDLLASATAERHGVTDLGAVVVYLPQRLSGHAFDLLDAIADRTIAATTGVARADREVVARFGPPDPVEVPAPPRPRVVSASDADEEVRAAVRAVIDAARAGTPFDRMAILHPGIEPYPRLVHEHLDAARIAVNGPSVTPLKASVAGRLVLSLLELPSGGFRREDVFAWLTAAPVLHQGLPVPVSAWERISREAGVVTGRRDWSDRLARLARELDAAAASADPDEPAWRIQRARSEAARVRGLRRFVLALIDDLSGAASSPRAWSAHAAWVRGYLRRLDDEVPDAERDAAARVGRTLDRLASLDEVDGPVTLDVFGRTLQLEMDADLGRVGRFGEGVFVGPISMGVGLDLDLVVVLGLAEGAMPSTVHDDSLLPDYERAAAPGLPLARDRVDRQWRWLLASLAGAAEHLLCAPRGDLRRSTERVPSRWLPADGAVDHVASFDAGLRRLQFPATEQEHRLRTLLGATPIHDGFLDRGVEMVRARRSDRFTRFDGNLAGLAIAAPAETSATRLERWIDCPFAYLLGDVLGVDPIDNPEDHLQVAPTIKGELIHAILERFIASRLDAPPAPDDPWSDADLDTMVQVASVLCADYQTRGLTGRPIFWARDQERLHAELRRFLSEDSAHRSTARTRPIAAELAFGVRGAALPAVPLELPDGRVVRFRGLADRVDEAEDGTLHVVDYKTGRIDDYVGDAAARKLQLPIYALAARALRGADAPVHAEYWFVSTRANFRRVGYDVTDDVLQSVASRIAAVVTGIEQGVFPHHPTALSTTPFVPCPWCDPDGLGVADLQRRWARKQHDPALAPYVDVVSGD